MTKKVRFLFTLVLTLLFMSVSGCTGTTPVPATPTEEPVEEENAPAPEVVSVIEEPAEPDHCLECHTDKERLIDTAKPEEVVVSENEGEG